MARLPPAAEDTTPGAFVRSTSAGSTPRFLGAIFASVPRWQEAVFGAAVWAVLMSLTATLNLIADGWQSSDSIRDVALVFAGGGALAFPSAITAATLISSGRRWETRFSAGFVCLTVGTVAATALIYALEYRVYYAQWHAAAFSLTWMFQLFFTGLVSTVQFAVSGLPLYFPTGFICVPLAAMWFARLRR